jgi:uncharacterized protein YggL (DUF469 family)
MRSTYEEVCLIFDNSDTFDDFIDEVIQYLCTTEKIVFVTSDFANITHSLLDIAKMRKLTKGQLGQLVKAGILVAVN